MRTLTTLLIATAVSVFLISCQDSTTLPPTGEAPQNDRSASTLDIDYVLYGVSSLGDALSIIDLDTGVSTEVARLNPDPKKWVTPVAMGVRACDGEIFVWNNSDEGEEPNTAVSTGVLLTVDACTGRGTAVDTTTPPQGSMGALAFHPDGRLFGTTASLYEIDPTTGVIDELGRIGTMIAGADFHPVSGVLYGAELGGDRRFGTIDIETGAFSVIDTLGGFEGPIGTIAFSPTGDKLYGTAEFFETVLFEIDPVTAAVSNIDTIEKPIPQGMGFAPVCGQGGGDCGLTPEPAEMTLVIKPGGCPNPLNPKSKGVTPMALLGSDDVGVDDIDVSTLLINGVSPLRYSHEDVGGPAGRPKDECECDEGDYDEIMDLTLKFSTQALVATLGELSRGDVVTLTLTGMLKDGTEFEASECMVIVGK